MFEDTPVGAGAHRFRRVRPAVALLVALALALFAAAASPRGPAHAIVRPGAFIPSGLLEVSNSCALISNPPTTIQLKVWGSRLTANTTFELSDLHQYINPPVSVTTNGNGRFTATVAYAPNASDDYDIIWLNAGSKAERVMELQQGDGTCETNSPQADPCVNGNDVIPMEVTQLRNYQHNAVEGYDVYWYVDYTGFDNNQTPFGQSKVVNSNAGASLPPHTLSPGTYLITARAEDPLLLKTSRPAGSAVYWSFSITICGPQGPKTTTTAPPTTTTTIPVTKPTERLTVDPTAGPTGLVATVHGTGFQPNTVVNLAWSPGQGTASAVTDGAGNFAVGLLVMPHDILGPRKAFVVGSNPLVTADFLAGLGSAGPPDADAPFVFRQ